MISQSAAGTFWESRLRSEHSVAQDEQGRSDCERV